MTVVKDLSYRPVGEWGLLDVVRPDGDGPFPVVACIHGGGWMGGEKGGMHPFGTWLAEIGVATVLPNYRLTGTDIHPAQQEDVFAVLGWIEQHGVEFGFDPGRIGLTGSSAGAHLCTLVGMKAKARGVEGVRCMLPYCGVYDVALWAQEKPQYAYAVEALIGGPVALNRDAARDASPVAHVHPSAPPCLAVHGAADDIVPMGQSLLLVNRLKAAKVEAEAIIVPDVGHDTWQPGSDPLEPTAGLRTFQAFFTRHLLGR